ncbi:MAG: hypothetical protein DCC65_00080 [Planctomycetota bacterium]|nr:MAG: hypothetical protein DCC65_00080 [Planctomycetota bacterium]
MIIVSRFADRSDEEGSLMTNFFLSVISKCRSRGSHTLALTLFAAALLPAGCADMAATWVNMTGGDWIEPEYKLAKTPLLILIDDRNSMITEPKTVRELHQTLSENFLHFDVNKNVIPFQEYQRLQRDPNFYKMTIRQIGEQLGAEQVLYIGVERFTLHGEGDAPIYKGIFATRVKVLSTERKGEVRLWPDNESGKRVEVTTDPKPMDGDVTPGQVATELGIKMGQEIARFFYGRREFSE